MFRFKHFLLVLLLMIAGTVVYFMVNKKAALSFILPEIKKITLIKAHIHSDTAYVEIYAIAQNNAPYKISIDSIVCDLSLGGTKLLSEKEHIGLSQKSHQADTVHFSVKIPISHTRNTIQHLQSQDTAGLSLHASIIYSVRKLNFSKNKQIDVPIPPRIRILKTEKKSLKLLKKDLKVDLLLEIINDGKNLNTTIQDLHYQLRIGQDLDTKGVFKKTVMIRPHSSVQLKIPIDFNMEHPAATLIKVWTDNDRVPYNLRLTGFIDAGKMHRIPVIIDVAGTMEIVKAKKEHGRKK